MSESVPLFEISWDDREVDNAMTSIQRGSHWAKGPFVERFEAKIESYLDVDHALVVNSGTTALVAALRAHGVGEGDEVIVPPFSFIATANAVRLVGATPVFADIEPDTFGLDPAAIREKVTDRTAAILPVHVYGNPCRIHDLVTIGADVGVPVIEDAAEAFGATSDGDPVGTIGETGVLSFCQNKIITTGEGGAVVTDDDDVARSVELYRSHGRANADYFENTRSGEYVALGTNIRMADLPAAIGCAQIEKVDELLSGRREAAIFLNDSLRGIGEVSVPEPAPDTTHAYQLYTIELEDSHTREAIVRSLEDRNVDSKIYWDTPIYATQYYREMTSTSIRLQVTESVTDRVLSLPMYPGITRSELRRIVAGVREALGAE